jgi:propanol-preferring alcohol dehydrogenase
LWGERSISSVANLTRADGTAFMELADKIDLRPAIEVLPLVAANEALERLRSGAVQGAAVLVPEPLGKMRSAERRFA